MQKIFNHRATRRLADMIRQVRYKERKPTWIGTEVYNELDTYWKSQEFMKKSTRNKKNRASEKGGTLHLGGLVNTAKIHERLIRLYSTIIKF